MNVRHQYLLVGVCCLSSSIAIASEPIMGPSGESGLFRTASANISPPQQLRLGLATEFSSVTGLFTPDDHVTRWLAALSIGYTPWHFLEMWLNFRSTSTANNQTEPRLILTQGDLQFGSKGTYTINPLVTIGSDIQIGLRTAIDSSGYDLAATELSLRALLSLDLKQLKRLPFPLPLRVHTNVGFIIDNSGSLLDTTKQLTLPERYALDIYDFHRILLGIGIEGRWGPWLPFLEYSLELPLGYTSTRGIVFVGDPSAPSDPLANNNQPSRPAESLVIPQRITMGARYQIFDPLILHLALEIGITPEQAIGLPTVAPYKLVSFISYNFNHHAAPPKVPPASIQTQRGSIVGHVYDALTHHPITDVVIEIGSAPPTITSSTGAYRALYLSPGPTSMKARKLGYTTQRLEVVIPAGRSLAVPINLEPISSQKITEGSVHSLSGQPIPNAKIEWTTASTSSSPSSLTTITVSTGPDGSFNTYIKPSRWRVIISHPKYLSMGHIVNISKTDNSGPFKWLLHPANNQSRAKIIGQKVILPDTLLYPAGETSVSSKMSNSINALLDLMLSKPKLKVEIAGHTDSRGSKADNLRVSRLRAESVRTYLVDHGVAPQRIRTSGYGGTQPIAPNLTQAGRARNQRVDITVWESTSP